MSIITNIREQFNCEYVEVAHFRSYEDDASTFIEHSMPYPLTLKHHNEGYSISWALDGYSGTSSGREYKFDTIDKIARALGAEVLNDLPDTSGLYHPHINKYKEFKGIILDAQKPIYQPEIILNKSDKDLLFDYCRFDIYALKAQGTLYYEKVFHILETANVRLGFNKSHADIRSKARNMLAWTADNYGGTAKSRSAINGDYYNKIKGETMTKKEAAKVASDAKARKARTQVETAINVIKFQDTKLTKSAVSRMAKVHRDTVAKYWDELV